MKNTGRLLTFILSMIMTAAAAGTVSADDPAGTMDGVYGYNGVFDAAEAEDGWTKR